MAKRKKPRLVTKDWREIAKLWSVQASALVASISTAYASSDTLQEMVSPSQFGVIVALSNVVVIVLRTLAQSNTDA